MSQANHALQIYPRAFRLPVSLRVMGVNLAGPAMIAAVGYVMWVLL